MFFIGTTVPDKNMMRKRIKNEIKRACWRFLDRVEMYTQIPIFVKRPTAEAKKNRGILPFIGTPNQRAIKRLGKRNRRPMARVGMTFARIISYFLRG